MQNYKAEMQSRSKDIEDNSDFDKVSDDILDNIRSAYDYAKDSNIEYEKNVSMVFCDSLTDSDRNALEDGDRPTLTFSVIAPILKHQLKNITDSVPESSVATTDVDTDPNSEQIAKGLTAKLQSIYDVNRYPDVVGEAAELAGTGGKAVFKIQTEYENNTSFDQKITIKSIPDPTLIFFDPCSKTMSKEDAEYVFEVSELSESSFKRIYPEINIEDLQDFSIKTAGAGIRWIKEQHGKKTVSVVDYCYKDYEKSTLYLVKDSETGQPITTKDKPKSKELILESRETNDISIKHIRICGDKIIEEETELNFKHLPYIFFCSDSKIVNGKEVIIPFAKPAIDAQRAKNISFNTLFFEMLNNSTGRFIVASESINDALSDAITNPSSKKNLIYDSRGDDDGIPVQNPPPQWIPSQPIPSVGLEVFKSLDETINTILGSQYYSLDQTNMSGKALYNLSDFMSASIATLMKNLIISTAQIGRVVLSALPFLYEQNEVDISNNSQKKNVLINYNEIDIEKYAIRVHKGANYALQQQVTIESLLEYSRTSPSFAQWLNTAGIPILLENTPLNGKAKIIGSYEQFQQQQQLMQQQMSMNKTPSPEQMKSQAEMLNAKNDQMSLQLRAREIALKEKELALKAHQAAAGTAIDYNKVQMQRQQGKAKVKMDAYQHMSENQRELLKHYKG